MHEQNERSVSLIVVLISLIIHALVLIILLVIMQYNSGDCGHITLNKNPIDYFIHTVTHAPRSIQPIMPSAIVMPTQAMQQLAQQQLMTQQPQQLTAQQAQQILAQTQNQAAFDEYTLAQALSNGILQTASTLTLGYGSVTGVNDTEAPGEPGLPDGQDNTSHDEVQASVDQAAANTVEPPATATMDAEPMATEPAVGVDSSNAAIDEPAIGAIRESTQDAIGVDAEQEVMPDPMAGPEDDIGAYMDEGVVYERAGSHARSSESPSPRQHAQRVARGSDQHGGSYATGSARTPEDAPPKQRMSLSDITKSFMRHVREDQENTGHYTAQQSGMGGAGGGSLYAPRNSAIPLGEQIYATKLYRLLSSAALAYDHAIYSQQELEMQTVLDVTIDKQGSIVSVCLTPPIPEHELEKALCSIVRSVGLFPPIPRSFKKSRIVVHIPLNIKSKQGFATYRLLYGMHG